MVDSGDNRVQRFTKMSMPTVEWGSEGGGNGEFRGPSGTAIGPDSWAYVIDTGNGPSRSSIA